MVVSRALIVAEPGPTSQELAQALTAGGFQVERASPAQLLARAEPDPCPDLLLISAALGLQRLALLSQRFSGEGKAPTTLVFPEGDFGALEVCVRGGFDYVTPPYLPSLMRSRMTSCWDRMQLTAAVADMAAAASLREYERELSIAHDIQSGFLPEELPTPQGWGIAARFQPAKQVAGDFYDLFELVGGRRLAVVIADVCDKGLGSALFMALIRTLLRHTAEHTSATDTIDADLRMEVDSIVEATDAAPPLWSVGAGPLVQAVAGTNRYMARNHQGQAYFCTLFFGVLDPVTGALLYINGGHNPPLLVRADGSHTMLNPTGPAVGILPNSTFSISHTSLRPGDTLFAFTDGVVEARDSSGAMLGLSRLVDLVTESGRGAEEILDTVVEAIQQHVGIADQHDDITMVAVQRMGTRFA